MTLVDRYEDLTSFLLETDPVNGTQPTKRMRALERSIQHMLATITAQQMER
jgi:hypothetical protein